MSVSSPWKTISKYAIEHENGNVVCKVMVRGAWMYEVWQKSTRLGGYDTSEKAKAVAAGEEAP